MIKCIIIDDEPLAVKLLASYVNLLDGIEVESIFTNPLKALTYIKSNDIDLVLTDIQMPELSGITLAQLIDRDISIIFTTAYPEFAVDGFDIEAIDYLVKPISISRFKKSIERVTKFRGNSNPAVKSNDTKYIFVKSDYKLIKIDHSSILFMKGLGDYVAIHQTNGKKILTLENMKSFEESLAGYRFIRVHKSYIVNIDKIEFIQKNRIKIGEDYIPIGSSYQKEVMDQL